MKPTTKHTALSFLFCLLSLSCYPQNRKPIEHSYLQAQRCFEKGKAHNQADSALNYFQQSKKLLGNLLQTKQTKAEILALAHQTWIHSGRLNKRNGQNKSAIKDFSYAQALAAKHQRLAEEALSLNELGTLYQQIGDWEKAKLFLHQALAIEKKLNIAETLAITLNNIGLTYFYHEEYEAAIGYFNEALQLKKQTENHAEASTLNNLGLAYLKTQQFDSAKHYLNQAQRKAKLRNDSMAMLRASRNYGEYYMAQGQFKHALSLFREAIRINNKKYDVYETALTYLYMAKAHLAIGNWKQTEYFALESQALAIEFNYAAINVEVLKILSSSYAGQGHFAAAYHLAKEYKLAQDSLFAKIDRRQIREVDILRQAELKDKQIKRQQATIKLNLYKKSRSTLELSTFALLSLAAIVVLYFVILDYKQNKQKEAELTQSAKQIEQQKQQISQQLSELKMQTSEIQIRNEEITAQKEYFEQQKAAIFSQTEQLEELQGEMISSLFYAQKIQKAVFSAFQKLKNSNIDDFFAHASGDILSSSFVKKIKYIEREVYIIVDNKKPGIVSAFAAMHAFTQMEAWLSKVKRFRSDEINQYITNKIKDFLGKEYEDTAITSAIIINTQNGQFDYAGAHSLWKISRKNPENYVLYTKHKHGTMHFDDAFYIMSEACTKATTEDKVQLFFAEVAGHTIGKQKEYIDKKFSENPKKVTTDYFILGIMATH